jgi:hypothetical protein
MNDEQDSAWKTITYVTGAALGLVMGLAAAHLYARTAEENGEAGSPVRIETGDALKIGLAAVALVRQVSSLGAKKSDDLR